MTTYYFCKLCDFGCDRERDIREHLFYEHAPELYDVFECENETMLPKKDMEIPV